MKKVTQPFIRGYIENGIAIDVSNWSFGRIRGFMRNGNTKTKLAVSYGPYGANGVLIQDQFTGEMYACAVRNRNMFMML